MQKTILRFYFIVTLKFFQFLLQLFIKAFSHSNRIALISNYEKVVCILETTRIIFFIKM